MSIPRIFAELGEPAFRDLETRAAQAFSLPRKQVVSTGGGILGREDNVRLLRAGGLLVCLRARPEVVLKRTAPWDNRPMLRDEADPADAVRRLLAQREPQYAQADFAVDTSDLTVPQVVEEICARLTSQFSDTNTGS